MNKEELIDWIDRPPSNHDLDNINYIICIFKQNEQLKTEKEQLNSLVNSCQQEIRKLQSTLEEIREFVKRNISYEKNSDGYEEPYLMGYEIRDLLQIIDKGVNNEYKNEV